MQDTIGTAVILDGRQLYPGHRLAWRRGRIIAAPTTHEQALLVQVRFERRGRERKHPEQAMPVHWLLRHSPELLGKLEGMGLLQGRDDAATKPNGNRTKAEHQTARQN